jgi:hypothetical protein
MRLTTVHDDHEQRAERWRSVAGGLEDEARSALHEASPNGGNGMTLPSVWVTRELAFVLDTLDSWRAHHASQLGELAELEQALGSAVLNLPPYENPQCKGVWEWREKLNDRLLTLHANRRSLAERHAEREAALHERLFTLLQRHAVLRPLMQNGLQNGT